MMKSVLISGGAQGIGAAIARLFYQKNYNVGIYDLNVEKACQLAQSLGIRAHAGQLDVSDYSSWQAALEDFHQWAGELHLLINNAGILYSGAFEEISIEQHQRLLDINVKGVLNGCHAALPYLQQASQARVINLSSASAIYGQPDLVSYAASKFAVRGISEGLDIEWAKYGIRVLDVMPLFVATDMVVNMDAASIRNMGVSLSSQDVAKTVYRAATRASVLCDTHWLVGLKSQCFYQVSGLSPQRINRWINTWINRRS